MRWGLLAEKNARQNIQCQHHESDQQGTRPGQTLPIFIRAHGELEDHHQPMANLPVVIFQFAMSPYENWIRLAWGGALLITLSVLLLNIVARVFLREKAPK